MCRILEGAGVEVMHRSMPYEARHPRGTPHPAGRHWPTDRDFDGFNPDWMIIMERGVEVTAQSQVRAGHVEQIVEACENIAEAWRRLATWRAEHNVPHMVVRYEQLVEQPTRTIEMICRLLRIDPPEQHEEIYDGNAKYRQVRL